MSRIVLGTALLLTAAAAGLLSPVAAARVVDTGQTQCCSAIVNDLPPATYYGATMYRNGDPRSAWQPYITPPMDPPAPVEDLLQQIDALQDEGGPMSPALAAPLAGLGTAYLAEGRVREGIRHLSHGIHLVRVNEGLYTPSQIEMLEQLIAAHVRRGDFIAADEQQAYLYRVKKFGQKHLGNADLREATLTYANWMRGAYLGDIDRQRFPRLVGLNDLYQEAIDELVASSGDTSPELLPYLQGRIELSYLISVYPGEKEATFRGSASGPSDFKLASEAQLRFWRMRDHNFRYGLKALKHKEAVVTADPASTAKERAAARVAIADWYQWDGQYAPAVRIYEEAWHIAAEDEGTGEWLRGTFGQPLELPQETVFNPSVIPIGTLNTAEVTINFTVSRHGEAKDIDILNEPTDEDAESAITRAYHYLRNVRFRPQLENGEVVASSPQQRTYQIRY